MRFKIKSLPLILFFLPWTFYFTYLNLNAIQATSSGWISAYIPHWGDGAAHLSYMAAFAFRQTFPITHPLFFGHPFTYSFAADMIGGLISRLGLPLWLSYNLWGALLSLSLLIALWLFMKRIFSSSWLIFLALNLFLFSGGLGFKYLITDRLFPETAPVPGYFFSLLTQRENTDIVWLNVIVGELLPQRALLLALPLGLFLLFIWYKHYVLNKPVSKKTLLLTGVILGLMPVIHPHTTMFVSLSLAIWILMALVRAKKPVLKLKQIFPGLLYVVIPTLLLGGFLTFTFLVPSVSEGFFRWYPGWMARSKNVNWLVFWLNNWGLFLPLALTGTVVLRHHRPLFLLLLPGWSWFILANLFLFQPYDWDNSKLLTWVYLFFTIPVTLFLYRIWQQHLAGKLFTLIIVTALTLSGAVDAVRMLDVKTHQLTLVNQEELGLAAFVKTSTSPEAVFLTSTSHRNWVPILTGRQVLCGYLGWMWTYGINADERVADLKAMYSGSDNASDLIRHYGIDYVVIGPGERAEFAVDEFYFSTRYPVAVQTVNTTIYAVTADAAAPR